MSQPREFWIDDITLKICGPWSDVTSGQMAWPDNEKVIHVIEKSHADKLEAALKEAVEALKNIKSETLKIGHAQFTVLEHSRAIVDETLARIEEALK